MFTNFGDGCFMSNVCNTHTHTYTFQSVFFPIQCAKSLIIYNYRNIFEVYDSLPNPTLQKMNEIVKSATALCTAAYVLVGFFGYVAFSTKTFSGNVMLHFTPSISSDIIKMGFVLSIACSFPLVIFPCRASLYSLLYRRVSIKFSKHQP